MTIVDGLPPAESSLDAHSGQSRGSSVCAATEVRKNVLPGHRKNGSQGEKVELRFMLTKSNPGAVVARQMCYLESKKSFF